ncbi:MAG: complexin-2 [Verrucomicrobia bacterium]|nr:complexin-2 [Verrucomicrobiota bacterium]
MYVTRPKSIQIDYSFYLDLISYAFMHGDPHDPCFSRIEAAFRRKIEAMERHELYTLYKSGASQEIRDKAREEYLEAIGLREAFHWNTEHDVNVIHDFDAML